jgi:hypothetical protein
LDTAGKIGLQVKVTDESEFWTKRDGPALVREIGRWNELIAGVGGQLKDAAGPGHVTGPIFAFPDFEHLEAREAAREAREAGRRRKKR